MVSSLLQELDRLLKEARAGKSVKEDDIPPPVVVKGGSNAPAPSSVPALRKETPAVQPTVTQVQGKCFIELYHLCESPKLCILYNVTSVDSS